MGKKLPITVSVLTVGASLCMAAQFGSADTGVTETEPHKDTEQPVAESQQESHDIVQHIIVEGNQTVPQDAILKYVTNTKVGDPYSKEVVKKDLEAISQSGIVQKVSARSIQNNGELYVVFTVAELSDIKTLTLDGNTLIPKEDILPKLICKPGDKFEKSSVEADIETIKKMYSDKGYIAIVSNVNNTDGDVTFHIQEAKIEDIAYEGNKKTKSWVMDKIVGDTFKKGEFLTVDALQKAYRDLQGTGFFKTVNIEAKDGSEKGKVIINIKVDEDKTGEWRLGGGYSNQYKAELVGGVSDKNIGGTAKSVNLDFGVGKGKNSYGLSFVDPYYKGTDTSVYFNLFKNSRDIDNSYGEYTENHTGGEIGFNKPISTDKKTSFFASFNVDKIGVDKDRAATNVNDVNDNTLTVGIRHDTRDKGQVEGTVTEAAVSTSQEFFGSDNNFTKFMAGVKNYARLSAKDVLASRLSFNYSPDDIPAVEQFSIGGANSVRGLDEDEQKGNKSVLATLELRHDLSDTVQGVVFVDAGKAWNDSIDNAMKVGTGLGLRIKTAMGILRLDAAKSGGNSVKYMFGIGQSF